MQDASIPRDRRPKKVGYQRSAELPNHQSSLARLDSEREPLEQPMQKWYCVLFLQRVPEAQLA